MRGVWKYFDSLPALQDVNLDVQAKERVVIIGPSGSGKSTALRSINRLEEIDRGKIYVNGLDIMDKTNDINLIRNKLGICQHALFKSHRFHRTVLVHKRGK